jgi:predicted TPR repeat methyltransferase
MTDPQHDTTADRVEQLFRAGRPQEAIELCRRNCQAPEVSSEDWLLYGCVSADTGDTATAMMALGKAAELDPDSAEAQFGLGKLLAAAGDYTGATARLQKAAELQPDNPDIWLALGITHGLAKDGAKAEECCRRSLELQPGSANALFNLANALHAQGKLSEAEAKYESALKIEPRLLMGWNMLSQTQTALKKYSEAEVAARQALTLEPRYGEAHYTLAVLLAIRGEKERARDHLRQVTELLPNFRDGYMRLGQVLSDLGDYAGASESFERLVDLDPASAEAHFLLGESLRAQRLFERTESCYRKALALNSDHLLSLYNLAFILVTLGRNAEAATYFAEVLRINPNDEQARHLLAAQQGQTTTSMPASYVVKLFDEFADKFDAKLVGALNYHTPERLHEMVSGIAMPAANSLDIIDLGCGTGLCAPLFRNLARALHGVDLSPRMIEKARERKLYDSLEVGDIVASLRSREAAWDLAICADVLIYLGDLKEVFSACSFALRPGGLFAFSIEDGDDSDGIVLRQSGRYAHARRYIRELAGANGLQEIGCRALYLRHEKGKKMPGYIFLLRRQIDLPNGAYRQKIDYVF